MLSLAKIAKGAGIVFFGMVFGKVIGYLYVIFVSRLGTEQFGLLNLAYTVISLLSVIALLGLENGLLRYIPYYQAKRDNPRIKGTITYSLKICLFLSIIFTGITFLYSKEIATYFFHNIKLAHLLRIFTFILPFSVITSLFLSSFRAFQRVEYEVGLKEIVEKAVRLLTAFFLVSLGFGVIGAAYSYLVSSIIVFFVALYIIEKKVFPVFSDDTEPQEQGRELLLYSIPLMLSNILVFIISWTDTLMLGYFRNASEVGIYNAAHPTAALMFIMPTAFISLFLPIITGLYSQKKYEQIKKLYKRVSRWIFFVNFPVFLIMAFFSRQIIRIIFGQDYVSGAIPLTILVFGYLIYSLAYTSGNILNMAKKTKLIFFITLIFAGSNVVLNYLLIPKYGVSGAAIATSVSFIVAGTFYISFSHKITETYPINKSFFKSFLAGLLAVVIVYCLTRLIFEVVPLYGFILVFFLFMLLYLGLLFLFRGFENEDFEILKVIIRRFRLYM